MSGQSPSIPPTPTSFVPTDPAHQDRLEIAVIESTMLVSKRNSRTKKRMTLLVNVFNVIIEDKQHNRSLVRYIDDFVDFDQKVKVSIKAAKVVLPALDEPLVKRRVGSHGGLRGLFLSLKERQRSNSEKIEAYLRHCFKDPSVRQSTLFRDFLSAQRDEDRVTSLSLVHSLLRQHHHDQLHDSILPASDKTPPMPPRHLHHAHHPTHHHHHLHHHRSPPHHRASTSSTSSSRAWTSSLRRMTSWVSNTHPISSNTQRRHSITSCSSISSLPSIALGENQADRDEILSHDLIDVSSEPAMRKITIQHFQFIKVIGRGCMGKVFLVRRHGSNQLLALKAIRKQLVLEQDELAHTLMERDILTSLAQINHPFLIRLHHAFQDSEQLFLILDYHVGGDLATQLSLYLKFPPERCQLYTAEILLGLQELHRLGILYRDLKPENILLAADGHLILTDFGLSKQFDMPPASARPPFDMSEQRTSTFCGTAEYIAPEVLRGEPYTIAVDFWSLGTILYEMLVGITPFWAETHGEMYQRVLHDELEFPEDMDAVTSDFITCLLQRNPLARLGTGPEGPITIRSHPYFDTLEWPDVYYKRLRPSYIPAIQSNSDYSHFDSNFLNMSPRLSPTDLVMPDQRSDLFQGYSFANTDSNYMSDSFPAAESHIYNATSTSIPFDAATQGSRPWSSYDSLRDSD
ncbi:kinase-like domain-containing protein [Gongronella butleri]|nr:kinase-like domain-containing protein [Gongronella butleri]